MCIFLVVANGILMVFCVDGGNKVDERKCHDVGCMSQIQTPNIYSISESLIQFPTLNIHTHTHKSD